MGDLIAGTPDRAGPQPSETLQLSPTSVDPDRLSAARERVEAKLLHAKHGLIVAAREHFCGPSPET